MHLPSLSFAIDVELDFTPSNSPADSLLSKDNTTHQSMQEVVGPDGLEIQDIETLTGHLHHIVHIRLSGNGSLTLKSSPSTATSLLQHERCSLDSEAAILSQLFKSNLPIPRILVYDKPGKQHNSPFILTTTLPGIPYSSLLPHLTPSDRDDISQQIHTLRKTLNTYTSPNGTFGPAAMVAANSGFGTWREAFRTMMHDILMDGENVTVNLPYAEIRAAVAMHSRALNVVREARLVVLGSGRPENVLVEKKTNDVTGILDFGRAVWGDVRFGDEAGDSGGVRGFL